MAIFGGERIGGMLTIRPMLDTDSTFYDMIATPVLAAALHSHPMLDTCLSKIFMKSIKELLHSNNEI
jgi:hypothetical protein